MKIGVVGATGLVGATLIPMLEEMQDVTGMIPFASERSAGQIVHFRDQQFVVKNLEDESLNDCDILFTATEGLISKPLIERRLSKHALIIDNASTYRLDKNVPLIIPEVNPEAYQGEPLIANPNCTTIQLLLAIHPLMRYFDIKQCIVSSYQSVSGTGQKGMDELTQSMKASLDGSTFNPLVYPRVIAGNVIPQCDKFDGDWSLEELKIVNESKKILQQSLNVTPTCVRVPVYQGHHLSVTVKLQDQISKDFLESIFEQSSRIKLMRGHHYPVSDDIVHSDYVIISRLRQSLTCPYTWSFWVSADNIRVGAATNAIKILQMAMNTSFIKATTS